MNDQDVMTAWAQAWEVLQIGFSHLPKQETEVDLKALGSVLKDTAVRLRDNYPYFHPLYAGQMMKPPHPVAHLAYSLAMLINPNNHAIDGGRASSAMEKETIAELAGMFDWPEHLGHLCGGGTMANLEALWIAAQISPGKSIVASQQAHYTHERVCKLLGVPFRAVAVDTSGRMDFDALKETVRAERPGTVVATLGTTALGAIDPLPEIIELRKEFPFRLHVDAAYGGYYRLSAHLSEKTRQAYDFLEQVDSLVIDPHKHGLQPYGCGAVLFRDPTVGRFYKHDSPYTYFSSADLHLGEISLECSRPGAAAVALWATQRLLPLMKGGAFSGMLDQCRAAALDLQQRLVQDKRFIAPIVPALDIVIWAPRAGSVREISELSQQLFHETARRGLHLALVQLPVPFLGDEGISLAAGSEEMVTCLRSVLMKPEHHAWMDRIWGLLSDATDKILRI